ncbi:MAG: diguanylate cyclase [Desertifilum sp.]|nr:diguanylate cyclase [Desertifilum sp.]
MSKANILVVDDYPDNLRTLSFILSERGYRVRKAIHGEMALETIQVELPDLILLDIRMPQMDGYQVCTKLKAEDRTRDIPIIFLSAMNEAADKVKAFAVGGADYIAKPFQEEEVLARIQYQLTIRRQQQAINEQNRRLQQEIQERYSAQAETQLLLTVIQSVSQASDFPEALQAVLCAVRQAIGWDYGEAWSASLERDVFLLSQTCYDRSDAQLQQFHQASLDLIFPLDGGLPGQIWKSHQPHWIEDISQTSALTFLGAEIAAECGLKTAFGVPIVSENEVLTILVFFKRSQMPQDAKLLQLISAIALQLGLLMRRKQAEDALRQLNQELQRLANLDGLTQIANRRYFNQVFQVEWQRLKREQQFLSVILADVDYFKLYNDYYGHQAGDECLKQIAHALEASVRRPADLVARYGGEEFIIVLPNTIGEGAVQVAEKIQKAIANLQILHQRSNVSDRVTLSLGIASIVPSADIEPGRLIATADRALYEAKANGRNTFRVRQFQSSILTPTPDPQP